MVALGAWLCMLAVIGGYGISVTLTSGFELRAVRTLHDQLNNPTSLLVAALQQERRLSLEYLGSGRKTGRDALEQQIGRTDQALATFRRLGQGDGVQDEASPNLKDLISSAVRSIGGLETLRKEIADGQVDRTSAADDFTSLIDAAFRIYRAMPVPDAAPALPEHHQAMVALQRGREVLSQEIALLAGALASGRLTSRDRTTATELSASQRTLFREAEALLDEHQLTTYRRVVAGPAFDRLRNLEDELVRSGDKLPSSISTSVWAAAGVAATDELRTVDTVLADDLLSLSDEAARDVFLRTGIVVGVGLTIVALFVIVWIRVAPRHVATQLTGLKEAALSLAQQRLPNVVERLSHGERVDVGTVAPPLEFGPDEFGEVGRAFNAVQQTAVQTAIDQADLHNGVRDVFVALARRSQGLIRRQLTMIHAMEHKYSDPDELKQLFAIDHLATRMQRHAEALVILSGATPGRQWRNPVPVVDVVRGAVGEVESYSRVAILPIPPAAIVGHAVADVIHLVAELAENATRFSPPSTKVRIGAEVVPAGLVIELEDAGPGMSDEELELHNRRLAQVPDWDLPDARRLGLFVVARLAARHDINVHLRRSPYGGTTAIVLVPEVLIHRSEEATETQPPASSPPEPVNPTAGVAPPAPVAAQAPAAGGNAPDRTASPTPASTEEELPHRVRQASLAAPLRESTPRSVPDVAAPRPPEEVRARMTAFQRGTVQGRADAAKKAQPSE